MIPACGQGRIFEAVGHGVGSRQEGHWTALDPCISLLFLFALRQYVSYHCPVSCVQRFHFSFSEFLRPNYGESSDVLNAMFFHCRWLHNLSGWAVHVRKPAWWLDMGRRAEVLGGTLWSNETAKPPTHSQHFETACLTTRGLINDCLILLNDV